MHVASSHRARLAGTALVLAGVLGQPVDGDAQQRPAEIQPRSLVSLDTVLTNAQHYLSDWQTAFASVVAEEQLTQFTQRVRFPSVQQRTRSDLLLLRMPQRDAWQPFRDVYEVNGRAVRDRDDRLQRLFLDHPEDALQHAERIADESSRYNIGNVVRNIDVPTFALAVLGAETRARFRFAKRGEERLAGTVTWRVDFKEQERPTIVRTLRDGSVPLEGQLWIEPMTGRVLKTLIKTAGTPDPGVALRAPEGETPFFWVQVTYAPNDALAMLVPVRMEEASVAGDRSSLEATAIYSNFRRFDVSTKEVLRLR